VKEGPAGPSGALAAYAEGFAELRRKLEVLDSFALLPVEVYGPEIARGLAEWLRTSGLEARVVEPGDGAGWERLAGTLLSLARGPGVVVVIGTGKPPVEFGRGMAVVNQLRDSIARHLGRPLLWAGPAGFLEATWEAAPDFWSVRMVCQRLESSESLTVGMTGPWLPQEEQRRAGDLEPLFAAAMEMRDWRNAARLGVRLASAYLLEGDADAARTTVERAMAAVEQGDPTGDEGARWRAVLWDPIARVQALRGQLDEALRIRRDEELPVYQRLGEAHSVAVTKAHIASILERRGQLNEALGILREEVVPVFEQVGDLRWRAEAMREVAEILSVRGQADDALRILRGDLLPFFERLGDTRSRAVAAADVADILAVRGQHQEALRLWHDEILPAFAQPSEAYPRALLLPRMVIAMLACDRFDEAVRVMRDQVLPALEHTGWAMDSVYGRRLLGLALLARGAPGDREEADRSLRRALADAEQMRIPEAGEILEIRRQFGLDSPPPAS